ncbi:MAG: thioredoxin domain-containing protein [Cyanobacteriota bacterium]|nr:thioredoxin domain-containing protein [Cyanobacteriota bacterium]
MLNVSWAYINRIGKFVSVGFLLLGLLVAPLPAYALGNDIRFEEKVLQVIRNHPEAIVESLQVYQQQQRAQLEERKQAFLQQMKADPPSVIGQSPMKGAKERDVVLLIFSDFQCPYCAQVHQTLKRFMEKHGERATLVYKHLPLAEIHPQALPAAFSAWAAGQQGQFWAFHDALFARQDELGEPLYQKTAKALNLNLEQFELDRNSDAAAIAIGQDIEMARVLAVEGTPFLVLNGEAFPGAVELADLETAFAKVNQP